MSGARFDRWRAWAIETVENDLQERDFLLDRWGGDVRDGSRLWADYLRHAFDPQTTFGQLVSGAMVLAYWWLRAPRDFMRSCVRGTPQPRPRVMFLTPMPPPLASSGPAADDVGGPPMPIARAASPLASRSTSKPRRATKVKRTVEARPSAKTRRAAPQARRRAARKRRSSG